MPILAIAGGTSSSFGRAIISSLLSTTTSWTAILLSRSPKTPLWLRALDPTQSRTNIKAVNYLSPTSLTEALTGVSTLLSVISATDGSRAQIEINLLNAAIEAGCRRFAPCAWSLGPECYEYGIMKALNEGVWDACLKKEGCIEVGRFNVGMLMNYLGPGIFAPVLWKEDEATLRELREGGGYLDGADGAIQGMRVDGDLRDGSGAFLMSCRSGIAELPVKDDGGWPRISATSLRDIGRFVVAALELPRWEREMNLVGDTISIRELLKIAETVTGKRFDVTKITSADLDKQRKELKPEQFMEQLWVELKSYYSSDMENVTVVEPVVNRLCPEVKPVSFKEYIQTHWRCYQAEQDRA